MVIKIHIIPKKEMRNVRQIKLDKKDKTKLEVYLVHKCRNLMCTAKFANEGAT